MKTQRELLKYIDCKSMLGNRGQVWIGYVTVSKTGRTVYFNGMAFHRKIRSSGNHVDVETREPYWSSGIKRTWTNRHWAGGGVVVVGSRAEEGFRCLTERQKLEPKFEVTDDIVVTDAGRFERLLNRAE